MYSVMQCVSLWICQMHKSERTSLLRVKRTHGNSLIFSVLFGLKKVIMAYKVFHLCGQQQTQVNKCDTYSTVNVSISDGWLMTISLPFLMSLSAFFLDVFTACGRVSPSSSLYHSKQVILVSIEFSWGMGQSEIHEKNYFQCFYIYILLISV